MEIKLKVLSKKVKNGNKSFLRYFTYLKMIVVGQEEKGKQEKSLTVKFTEECSNRLRTIDKDLRFFVLTIDLNKDQLSCPRKYEIKQEENEKTGEMEDVYPVVWVRGFEKVEKLPQKPLTDDVEFDTDEEPTEETEIVSE